MMGAVHKYSFRILKKIVSVFLKRFANLNFNKIKTVSHMRCADLKTVLKENVIIQFRMKIIMHLKESTVLLIKE